MFFALKITHIFPDIKVTALIYLFTLHKSTYLLYTNWVHGRTVWGVVTTAVIRAKKYMFFFLCEN